MGIKRFEEIEAWQEARKLNRLVHSCTRSGTAFDGDPDLRRQIRKASVSVMANIAEGFDAGSDAEFLRFLKISRRSASEIQSHLYAALDEGYLQKKQFDEIYDQAGGTKRLIGGFMVYLGFSQPKRSQPRQ